MKPIFLLLCSFIILINSCNDPVTSTPVKEGDGTISETTLPKGKYIIEDEIKPNKPTITEQTSINGLGKKDSENNINNNIIPQQDKDNNLKRRYKNLLVFHADDTMKIKKAYVATLILGKDQVLGSLKTEAFDGSSNGGDKEFKTDTTIEIGTKMRATLFDMSDDEKEGFKIEFLGIPGSEEQKISEKRKKARWQWRLTPLKPGLQELKLSVTLIEKDDEAVNLPVRNIPIVIFAEKESYLDKIGGFFVGENIKWILTVILIPIFIAWITSRIKYRHESKPRDAYVKSSLQNIQFDSNNQPKNEGSLQPTEPPQTIRDPD